MKVQFAILLAFATTVFAGEKLKNEGTTPEERAAGAYMCQVGAALLFTVVGTAAGIAMIAADNEDGSRSCWTKVLDATDIPDEATYNAYRACGIPVEELLKHTDAAIFAPAHDDVCQLAKPRVVLRNRRAEQFTIRPTGADSTGFVYHMDKVPKMLKDK